jgi:addiction module RelE/StbE family toxin
VLTLVWSEAARRDIANITSFIAERNAGAAVKLADTIEACADRLPEHPYLYRSGRVPGTREAVVHPNYILVYRVLSDSVEILSVIHTRRQYPPAESE